LERHWHKEASNRDLSIWTYGGDICIVYKKLRCIYAGEDAVYWMINKFWGRDLRELASILGMEPRYCEMRREECLRVDCTLEDLVIAFDLTSQLLFSSDRRLRRAAIKKGDD